MKNRNSFKNSSKWIANLKYNRTEKQLEHLNLELFAIKLLHYECRSISKPKATFLTLKFFSEMFGTFSEVFQSIPNLFLGHF